MEIQSKFYPFSERKLSDACWSLSTGPDGRIYAAACVEFTPGRSGTVIRYDEVNDRLEYLYDLDKVSGDPADSGRATQCKVHYSFVPSPKNDIIYSATHLSGPPINEHHYCPWNSWHDQKRAFRGSYLTAYDTISDEVKWSKLMIPKEGCRCLCLDDERDLLYAITYPRDHFVIYDLKTDELTDIGRIDSVNCQCFFMDYRHRVYFSDAQGRLNQFDPDRNRLEHIPVLIAHSLDQSGWHGVIYDAVEDPVQHCIYMVPWMVNPHLMRYWPYEGEYGRLEDLGPVNQERDPTTPISMSLDHVGGLVFGEDHHLYYVKASWTDIKSTDPENFHSFEANGVLTRMNTDTLETEELISLKRDDGASYHYITRGARDYRGDLFFGTIGQPLGCFRIKNPLGGTRENAHLPLRMWG